MWLAGYLVRFFVERDCGGLGEVMPLAILKYRDKGGEIVELARFLTVSQKNFNNFQ